MMKHTLTAIGAAACLVAPVQAQDAEPASGAAPSAEVMILGMAHFQGGGGDLFEVEIDDVLAPQRQEELQALADTLALWEPTIVAVERRRSDGEVIQTRYEAYRAGEHDLSRNETQQIGFRLAAMLDHDRIHSVDAATPALGPDFGPEAFPPDMMAEIVALAGPIVQATSEEFAARTVGDFLHWMADPEQAELSHQFYHQFLMRLYGEEANDGALMTAAWYARNLLIVQNILHAVEARASEGPQRVLLIIGNGHTRLIGDFIEDSPYLSRVDVREALAPLAE